MTHLTSKTIDNEVREPRCDIYAKWTSEHCILNRVINVAIRFVCIRFKKETRVDGPTDFPNSSVQVFFTKFILLKYVLVCNK